MRSGTTCHARFESPERLKWDLDIDDGSRPPKLLASACTAKAATTVEGVAVVVPSLESFMALKDPSRSSTAEGARFEALGDVASTVCYVRCIALESQWVVREFFEKHAVDMGTLERVVRLLYLGNAPGRFMRKRQGAGASDWRWPNAPHTSRVLEQHMVPYSDSNGEN